MRQIELDAADFFDSPPEDAVGPLTLERLIRRENVIALVSALRVNYGNNATQVQTIESFKGRFAALERVRSPDLSERGYDDWFHLSEVSLIFGRRIKSLLPPWFPEEIITAGELGRFPLVWAEDEVCAILYSPALVVPSHIVLREIGGDTAFPSFASKTRSLSWEPLREPTINAGAGSRLLSWVALRKYIIETNSGFSATIGQESASPIK